MGDPEQTTHFSQKVYKNPLRVWLLCKGGRLHAYGQSSTRINIGINVHRNNPLGKQINIISCVMTGSQIWTLGRKICIDVLSCDIFTANSQAFVELYMRTTVQERNPTTFPSFDLFKSLLFSANYQPLTGTRIFFCPGLINNFSRKSQFIMVEIG